MTYNSDSKMIECSVIEKSVQALNIHKWKFLLDLKYHLPENSNWK